MSIWSTIRNSVDQGVSKMKSFYDQKGIYEIRVNYATWIEERLSREKSSKSEEAAFKFYNDLSEHIQISAESQYNYSIISNRMNHILPMDFYAHLTEGIAMELLLIAGITPSNQRNQLQLIQGLIKTCNEFYQIPNLCFEPGMENGCDAVFCLTKIFDQYVIYQTSVFEELNSWKTQQILVGNDDVNQIDSLNQIQNCVELLVEVTFRMLQLVDSVRMRSQTLPDKRLDELGQQIRLQQESLMVSSFIVDNQPNQVIKTNTNIVASVRWLVGAQLGFNKSISKVECIVVSELQARQINRQRQMSRVIEPSSKEIRGNEEKMQYQDQNRIYFAHFKNLQIKKIQRAERRGSSESVMDEKLALLFYMTVTNNGASLTVWTLSLPVVVTVHGNQEHQAWATIIWDNAFSEPARDLFQVPDRVKWDKLSETLYLRCLSVTGRGFTEANKYFLYEKLFQNGSMMMNPNVEISWTKFCKEDLLNYTFSFWEWFYQIMKLIKDCLLGPWNAGLIEGFINKKITEEQLRSCPCGTFLLRFSDSIQGAITISYVSDCNTIKHIQPWNYKDLQSRCLADRIKDLVVLKELFPNKINKSDAFDKFCSPKGKNNR